MGKIDVFGLVFLSVFIFIFLIHYFIITKPKLKKIYEGEKNKKIKKKSKKQKEIELLELNYLVNKFNLNKNKLNWKCLAFMIAFINSFIMAIVVSILELIPGGMLFRLIIAFVLLFALIYSLYEIYGRYLKNKQEKESE